MSAIPGYLRLAAAIMRDRLRRAPQRRGPASPRTPARWPPPRRHAL